MPVRLLLPMAGNHAVKIVRVREGDPNHVGLRGPHETLAPLHPRVCATRTYPGLGQSLSRLGIAARQPGCGKAAWVQARQSVAYHFSADIQQTIIPEATVLNVARTSQQTALHLDGNVNLPDQQLHVTLWSQGGSVLNADSGIEVQVDGDHAQARQGLRQDRQEINNFTRAFAPQGDFMAFLAAAKDVQMEPRSHNRVQASSLPPGH